MSSNNKSRVPRPAAPFSLLVKPASADCNLRCKYCFYLEKSGLYPESRIHRMSDDVLERLVSSYMRTHQPSYAFGWQGGEPTLMGVEFFKKVTALQQKYGKSGAVVSNGLQTNATLIDDEFAAHLAEYRFLVGVSIDGPEEIHDTYRINAGGRGSHADVLRGVRALERHGVEYNALVLVSSSNVGKAGDVYDYLVESGIFYHQYIPCVEFGDNGEPLPFTITGQQWGEFLCTLFDRWAVRDTRRVSIRDFDAILGHMVDQSYSMCVQGGYCCQYFVVEHNGDVYPCDFFVDPDKLLGNVCDTTWEEMQRSSRYHAFGIQKSAWNEACTACPFLRYCSGDCLKQRYYGESSDPSSLSWLCEGWKRFYEHTLGTFEKIAVSVLNERELSKPAPGRRFYDRIPKINIGWTDPCYCGSGKKYRDCHGAAGSLNR